MSPALAFVLREYVLPITAVLIGAGGISFAILHGVTWWGNQDFKRADEAVRKVGKK